MKEKNQKSKIHPYLKWNGKEIVATNIKRSPTCNIIVDQHCDEVPVCQACLNYSGLSRKDAVEVNDEVHETIKVVFNEEMNNLDEWQKMFYKNQIQNASVSTHARRYHPDVIRWAIELFCRSPAAYDHIRQSNILILPSVSTIKSYRFVCLTDVICWYLFMESFKNHYRNCIPATTGLNKTAIAEIERVAKENKQLIGFITLDEMKSELVIELFKI
ncbi:uncharacterized protein LOC108950605 [Ciona intestinalis]